MRIFVTGATGFIGSAVVAELRGAGHDVLGLARSGEAADALARQGIAAHRGELTDADSLAAGARACDGVAHLAFMHDFSKYEENGEIDRRAVTAMADALAGASSVKTREVVGWSLRENGLLQDMRESGYFP